MNWLSFLFPQTIVHTSSNFNRDIRVVRANGKIKLLVNGIQQSGPMVDGFWNFAFTRLPMPLQKNITSILILGVGGGTVIRKLHQRYPKAKMTGVDIDGEIIRIGREQFGLSDIPNLMFVTSDARVYVRSDPKTYDLIVVDLYIGRDIPEFESSALFVRELRKRINPKGSVIFNFLHDGMHGIRAERLRAHLSKSFVSVHQADLPYNRFFLAR